MHRLIEIAADEAGNVPEDAECQRVNVADCEIGIDSERGERDVVEESFKFFSARSERFPGVFLFVAIRLNGYVTLRRPPVPTDIPLSGRLHEIVSQSHARRADEVRQWEENLRQSRAAYEPLLD